MAHGEPEREGGDEGDEEGESHAVEAAVVVGEETRGVTSHGGTTVWSYGSAFMEPVGFFIL